MSNRTKVSVVLEQGGLRIEPAPMTVSLKKRGSVAVLTPKGKTQMLDDQTVADALAALREAR